MDSNHQFGLPYHAVAIPASLKTHNNFNAHSACRTLWCRSHSPKEIAGFASRQMAQRSEPASASKRSATRSEVARRCRLGRHRDRSGTRAFRSGIRHARAFFARWTCPASNLADCAAIRSTFSPTGLTPMGQIRPAGMEFRRSCNRLMPGPASSIRMVAGLCCWARAMTFRRRSGYSSRPRNRSKR
jgi:hypothetical protein